VFVSPDGEYTLICQHMSYLPFGLFSSFIQTSPETDWENQGKSTSFRTEYSVVLRDPDSYRDSVALCVINIL